MLAGGTSRLYRVVVRPRTSCIPFPALVHQLFRKTVLALQFCGRGLPVSQRLASRRWLFRHQPIFHICGNAKLPGPLMASNRFNPGGSFLACARASDVRAVQSCLSRSSGVRGFMSSSLRWRSQVAALPAARFHRARVHLRLVDKPALSAPQGPVLEPGTC